MVAENGWRFWFRDPRIGRAALYLSEMAACGTLAPPHSARTSASLQNLTAWPSVLTFPSPPSAAERVASSWRAKHAQRPCSSTRDRTTPDHRGCPLPHDQGEVFASGDDLLNVHFDCRPVCKRNAVRFTQFLDAASDTARFCHEASTWLVAGTVASMSPALNAFT